MIWRFAIPTRQVHNIYDKLVSRNMINFIVNSCKEAREEAATIKLDSFIFTKWRDTVEWRDDVQTPYDEKTAVRKYANFEIDTIWRDWSDDFSLPEEVSWICGKCHHLGPKDNASNNPQLGILMIDSLRQLSCAALANERFKTRDRQGWEA